MRVLTDTHILLWSLLRPARLDAACRDLLESPEHQVFFSKRQSRACQESP
jgi:PIN domain nuclease of toxin-antitoxin system